MSNAIGGSDAITGDSMSSLRLGVVMDPIADIVPAKDSTLAMLLAAQDRGHDILYFEQADMWIADGESRGTARPLLGGSQAAACRARRTDLASTSREHAPSQQFRNCSCT